MISVETSLNMVCPVRSSRLSTAWTHRANRLVAPGDAVFPVVHTPYDCYERI